MGMRRGNLRASTVRAGKSGTTGSLPWGGTRAEGAPARAAHPRAGFSLIEVAIGTVILTVAITGLLCVIVSYSRLVQTNRESAIAQQAAREMIEKLQDGTFSQVFALYDANAADDPAGAGTAPGKDFVVKGLNAAPGDADGKVGEVIFPTVGNALREDVADADLSMPRDLNADGLTDAADHATNYRLLPVRIRLRWRGATGNRADRKSVV